MNGEKVIRLTFITTISVIIFCVLGITYAYFSLEIEGTSKDMVVTTGDLRIRYTDNDEINFNNAVPGDFVTKEVTIENIGTKDVDYSFNLNNYTNEIENGELVVSATCKSYDGNNIEESCEGFEKVLPTSTGTTPIIKNDINLKVGYKYVYLLTFTFIDTGEEQNYNKNKSFNTHLGFSNMIVNQIDYTKIALNVSGDTTQNNFSLSLNTNNQIIDEIRYEVYDESSKQLLHKKYSQDYTNNYITSFSFEKSYDSYLVKAYDNLNGNLIFEKSIGLSCFVAGTKVLTSKGYKNIEDIKIGDMVYSYNFDNNSKELKTVTNLIYSSSNIIYKITVNNETFEVSPRHQIYIVDKGWIRAFELKKDDKLLDYEGNVYSINNIEVLKYKKSIRTYNLTVDGNNNYYVTDNKYLVHNAQSSVMYEIK